MTEQEQLLENLIQNCSADSARAFLRRKNIHFKAQDEPLENADPDRFSQIRKIGRLDFEADNVVFAFAAVRAELSERSCRKAQFDAARKILRSENADAGLFLFKGANGTFRLSLVYKAYKGASAELSPYRRFTYFVQPDSTGNTTFRRQLGGCAFDSLEAIKKSFSIEAVSKEFYRELSNWYFWALKHIRFPEQNDLSAAERNPVCTIRLITRLMFVWFMKQMHLIPGEFFDREPLGKMLKSLDPEESTYYKAILQNLFFATLNTEMDQPKYPRRFRTSRDKGLDGSYGIHSVYRYRDLLTDPDTTLERFKTVPFLNGGLFECLDNTEVKPPIRIDGFSDRPDNPLHVPNFLFFGEEHAEDLSAAYGDTKRKKEKVSGLLDILSRYNFTVIENTPHESEVALDPELLGMVFENLLAAYNPETGATARKQTGSFYTPREIVSYKVDESLISHFKGKLEPRMDTNGHEWTHEQKLRDLLSYDAEGNPFDDAETATLIAAVDACQILDPACGSGAFPMGALHKLVLVLSKLDPGNERWLQTQLEKLDDVTMRDELERNFRENAEDYGRKLCLIENCIYGVDIQPIACQISKLRFFISLLCDQIVNPARPNLGIRPLPNLETKFVAANTLIGVERPSQMLLRNPDIDKLEKELAKVRHEHFKARTPKTKQKYRELDDRLRHQIGDLLIGDGWADQAARQIADWNPYDQNASAPFFDPEWMFAITDGFDVVIGNPPYVQIQKLPEREKEQLAKQGYKTFAKTADLYCLFYERGFNSLRPGGMLAFISSNKFFRAGYGKALRQLLNEEKELKALIDFGELPVFEAGTDPCIVLVANRVPRIGKIKAAVVKEVSGIRDVHRTLNQTGFELDRAALNADGWTIEGTDGMALLDKLRAAGKPLGEYVKGKFYYGIKTGFNEAFVIDRATRDRLIAEDKKSAELIKPWLRGQDIRRWYADYQELYVINIQSSANRKWPWSGKEADKAEAVFKKEYPGVFAHLKEHKEKLIARDDQGQFYWELRSCAYNAEFDQPKIVYADIAKLMRASYDTDCMFCGNTMYILPTDSLFLLGYMNGRLFDWYARNMFQSLGDPWKGGRLRYIAQYMEKVPVPAATPAQQKEIEALVEQILALKKEDPSADVSALEVEIDQLVYKLYDLTDEEIQIVDPAFAIQATAGKGKA